MSDTLKLQNTPRFKGVSDRSIYTFDADNLLAWWWDGILLEGILPFQIGSEWSRTAVKTPIFGLREDFKRKVPEVPADWERDFGLYFGKSFSRVAFPGSRLLRDKVTGNYMPGSESFPRLNSGMLPVYVIPPHHVCEYLFYERTRLRFPDFKVFDEERADDLPPKSVWSLI